MNETDIAMRLSTFPVVWLEGKYWLKQSVKTHELKSKIIADDFLFAKDNSLGIGKTPIKEAKPIAKE